MGVKQSCGLLLRNGTGLPSLVCFCAGSYCPASIPICTMTSSARPLDLTWDEPLPHALTRTLTYLSPPASSTQCAVIALHGRGDNARDFADAFVPHLRAFFGPHLCEQVGESNPSPSPNGESQGLNISLRVLEARDGIWFGTHNRKSSSPSNRVSCPVLLTDSNGDPAKGDADLDFQGPYVHSSLLRLRTEIEALNSVGIPNSRIVLVGFSQGAILVNAYLLRAIALSSNSSSRDRLPLPGYFLGWAGTTFSFEVSFPTPAWPTWSSPPDQIAAGTQEGKGVKKVQQVWSHNQCGSSDRYFSQSDIEAVAKRIQEAGDRSVGVRVRATAEMEAGAHSVLPGMMAKLIQMIQMAAALPS